jgi:U3 small nucleolar RNA-associated protein 20
MEGEGNIQREKRFKVSTPLILFKAELSLGNQHQSYQATLKNVHLPSALKQSEFDHDIGVGIYLYLTCSKEAEYLYQNDESHFFEATEHWRQLNLSPAFVQFATDVANISASMPLLVHHWNDIIKLWIQALDNADDEALVALLE